LLVCPSGKCKCKAFGGAACKLNLNGKRNLKGCIRAKILKLPLGGRLHVKHTEQSNVEFGCQLSICSGTKEDHGKPRSSWSVAGSSGCKLTSSQQSGTEHANPKISPCLCSCFIWEINGYIYYSFLSFFICLYKHQTVYNVLCGEGKKLILCEVCCSSNYNDYVTHFSSTVLLCFAGLSSVVNGSVWPPQDWTFPGL
jgi:hypothetical protein